MTILRLVESINYYESNLAREIISKANPGIYYTSIWRWKDNGTKYPIETTLSIVYSYDRDKLYEYVKKPQERTITRFSDILYPPKVEPTIYNTNNSCISYENAHYHSCHNYNIRHHPYKFPDKKEYYPIIEGLRENDFCEMLIDTYYDDYFRMAYREYIMAEFEDFLEN